MPLAITSLGSVTSVGHDVVTACAAIRASMVRAGPVTGTNVLDLETGKVIPVTGHPLRGLAEGFSFTGLWVRLAELAIRDVLAHGQLPGLEDDRFWARCEVMIALPLLDPERFPLLEEPEDAPNVVADFLETLAEVAGLRMPPARIHAFPDGHVGVAAALALAARKLDAGEADRCLVVAADSYLEPDALDWLQARRRLKDGERAVGLMPGEAGAGLLLESGRSASARGAEVLGWIQQVALGDSGRPLSAKGAARNGIALGKLLEGLLGPSAFDGDLLVDLNGEEWRASELGGAMARLGKRLESARLLVPAVQVGEIGAAAAALGLCFGVRSFRRRFARTGELLVTSMAESGRLAAIHLREA